MLNVFPVIWSGAASNIWYTAILRPLWVDLITRSHSEFDPPQLLRRVWNWRQTLGKKGGLWKEVEKFEVSDKGRQCGPQIYVIGARPGNMWSLCRYRTPPRRGLSLCPWIFMSVGSLSSDGSFPATSKVAFYGGFTSAISWNLREFLVIEFGIKCHDGDFECCTRILLLLLLPLVCSRRWGLTWRVCSCRPSWWRPSSLPTARRRYTSARCPGYRTYREECVVWDPFYRLIAGSVTAFPIITTSSLLPINQLRGHWQCL